METATQLADDAAVIQRVLDHIDNRTTDLARSSWREPVENYRSEERFAAELELLRRQPVGFCPSAALAGPGSFVAREAAGTPIVAVRGRDGVVRAFLNACSHRGAAVACESTGCTKALVFPYLDKADNGLAALWTVEHGGVVFVAQHTPTPEMVAEVEALPGLIPDGLR